MKRFWYAGQRSVHVALFVAIAAPVVAAAQGSNPPPSSAGAPVAPKEIRVRARLLGVFDEGSGEPIEGAEVLDLKSGMSALTTNTGTVALSFLSEGISLVRIRKVGFAVQTIPVAVSVADTGAITVVLPRATQLPAVVTRDSAPHYLSPRLNAFEERRRQGGGSFITEAELRKAEGRQLGDVLPSKVPGITVREIRLARWGKATVLIKEGAPAGGALQGAQHCYPDIYLDNVKMPAFAPGYGADLAQISVDNLAGVEYHDSATLPPQFSRLGSACGAVLLWSREGE